MGVRGTGRRGPGGQLPSDREEVSTHVRFNSSPSEDGTSQKISASICSTGILLNVPVRSGVKNGLGRTKEWMHERQGIPFRSRPRRSFSEKGEAT